MKKKLFLFIVLMSSGIGAVPETKAGIFSSIFGVRGATVFRQDGSFCCRYSWLYETCSRNVTFGGNDILPSC